MGGRPKPIRIGRARARVHRGPRADGRWYWRADRPDGHGGRIPIWHGWGTAEEAERQVIQLLADDPDTIATGATGIQVRTLYDVLDVWLPQREDRRDLAERTKKISRGSAERLAASSLARTSVERVSRRVIERYRDDLLQDYSPETVRLDLRILRQAWSDLRDQGLVPDRRIPSVRVVGRSVKDRNTPSREDVLTVLEVLRQPYPSRPGRPRPAWYWRATYLLWATGCRVGELESLSWDRIDLEGGRIEVEGKLGRRVVELHPDAVRELGTWEPLPGGRVWPHTRWGSTLRHALHRACRQLGIRPFGASGLRRLAVDTLYGVVGPDVAASQLGHSPKTAMVHYRQVRDRQRREALLRSGLGALPGEGGEVIHLPQEPAPLRENEG